MSEHIDSLFLFAKHGASAAKHGAYSSKGSKPYCDPWSRFRGDRLSQDG